MPMLDLIGMDRTLTQLMMMPFGTYEIRILKLLLIKETSNDDNIFFKLPAESDLR